MDTIALIIVEWLCGINIEYLFNFTFWNYSNLPLSMGKYVAIEISLIWGTLSLVFLYLLKKPSDKLVKIFPKWLSYALIILFAADNIFSIIKK